MGKLTIEYVFEICMRNSCMMLAPFIQGEDAGVHCMAWLLFEPPPPGMPKLSADTIEEARLASKCSGRKGGVFFPPDLVPQIKELHGRILDSARGLAKSDPEIKSLIESLGEMEEGD